MDIQAFQHLRGLLSQLTSKQKFTLRRVLHETVRQDAAEDAHPNLQVCPHCSPPTSSWQSSTLGMCRTRSCR